MAFSILLVDDDANFRRALGIGLRLEGVQVGEAASTDEARAALMAEGWDYALVNLLLPSGDGPELVEVVHAVQPTCRPIACSAHPELFRAVQARVPSVLQLVKPFTVRALLEILRMNEAPAVRRASGRR